MKLYLFLSLVACAAFFAVYATGQQVGRLKCNAQAEQTVARQQAEIIKIQENVNEKTFNIGVRDIRIFLHQKYTIAE